MKNFHKRIGTAFFLPLLAAQMQIGFISSPHAYARDAAAQPSESSSSSSSSAGSGVSSIDGLEAQVKRTAGKPAENAKALYALGKTLAELRRFDEAEGYLKQALELDRKVGKPSDIFEDLLSVALVQGFAKNMINPRPLISRLWKRPGPPKTISGSSNIPMLLVLFVSTVRTMRKPRNITVRLAMLLPGPQTMLERHRPGSTWPCFIKPAVR